MYAILNWSYDFTQCKSFYLPKFPLTQEYIGDRAFMKNNCFLIKCVHVKELYIPFFFKTRRALDRFLPAFKMPMRTYLEPFSYEKKKNKTIERLNRPCMMMETIERANN